MIWNATTPDDATYDADVIHTQIQNDKGMVSERFTAYDGTIHAHNAKDSDDAGVHQASLVGFAKIHATVGAMETWITAEAPPVGSLHAVITPASLYTIGADLVAKKVSPADHGALAGLDDDDHVIYQHIDLSVQISGDLTIAALTLAASDGGASDSLPTAHLAEDWETAHSAASFGGKHLATGAVRRRHIVKQTSTTGAGKVSVSTLGAISYPWAAGAGTGGFHALRIDENNDLGFSPTVAAAWFNGTMKYGELS